MEKYTGRKPWHRSFVECPSYPGEFARNCRIRAGLSMRELADRSGVSFTAVHYFEIGRCDMRLTNAVAIADALNVSLDELIGHKVGGSK